LMSKIGDDEKQDRTRRWERRNWEKLAIDVVFGEDRVSSGEIWKKESRGLCTRVRIGEE